LGKNPVCFTFGVSEKVDRNIGRAQAVGKGVQKLYIERVDTYASIKLSLEEAIVSTGGNSDEKVLADRIACREFADLRRILIVQVDDSFICNPDNTVREIIGLLFSQIIKLAQHFI
jgi:hypothetical protein